MTERPDVDALVEEIRRRVEQRRAEGAYPPGLEEDLDRQAIALAAHFRADPVARLLDRLEDLRERSRLGVAPLPTESRVPGGAVVHKVVGRVMARYANALAAQLQGFVDAVAAAEEAHILALVDTRARLDAALDRLADLERG